MIEPLCCQKVRDAFSAAAFRYDQLTDVHQKIGKELMNRVGSEEISGSILDIGMGSGWFTQHLTATFPKSMVVGLDFASGMIACARQRRKGFKIVQADAAHLPFKKSSFSLIASNLAYQWVRDLSLGFSSCRFCLKKTGKLYLTMFGHDTFQELFTALDTCADQKKVIIRRLAKESQVSKALKNAGFGGIRIQAQRKKVYFRDMLSLMKWIKDIGANTLPGNLYLGKDLLQKANGYYSDRFKDTHGVYATLEVIWVEAAR